jgi:hypothetical protein
VLQIKQLSLLLEALFAVRARHGRLRNMPAKRNTRNISTVRSGSLLANYVQGLSVERCMLYSIITKIALCHFWQTSILCGRHFGRSPLHKLINLFLNHRIFERGRSILSKSWRFGLSVEYLDGSIGFETSQPYHAIPDVALYTISDYARNRSLSFFGKVCSSCDLMIGSPYQSGKLLKPCIKH